MELHFYMRRQKRKAVKRPSSDDDDSSVDSKSIQKQDKSSLNESKNKRKTNSSPFSFDSEFEIDVKDGINDLATLPRELIESELINRGFHPDMTKALETKFLVNTLRSGKSIFQKDDVDGSSGFSYYPTYSYEMSINQAPIFDDAPEEILKKRKIEEKKRKEIEEEEEMMEIDQNLKPEEFKQDNYISPTETDQSNNNNFLVNRSFYFNYNNFNGRHLNTHLLMKLLNYGVDLDKLADGSPESDQLLLDIEADTQKRLSEEDIIFRNFVLNDLSNEDA